MVREKIDKEYFDQCIHLFSGGGGWRRGRQHELSGEIRHMARRALRIIVKATCSAFQALVADSAKKRRLHALRVEKCHSAGRIVWNDGVRG